MPDLVSLNRSLAEALPTDKRHARQNRFFFAARLN